MNEELHVEYRLFKDKITELSGMYERLCRQIGEMTKSVEMLDIFWDGDANTAYRARIERDMLFAGNLLIKIRDTIRLLRKAFDIYNENERKVQQMIGGVRK